MSLTDKQTDTQKETTERIIMPGGQKSTHWEGTPESCKDWACWSRAV